MSVFDSYEEMLYEFPQTEIPDYVEGQDINAPDRYGAYLLTAACDRLQVDNVKYFIAHGANPSVRKDNGDTALLCTIDSCHHDPAAAMQIIDILLSAGADIEARGYMGKTPFLKVCSRGCIDVLKLLVSRGCDINAEMEDIDGFTSGVMLADIFHTNQEFRKYLGSLYDIA